MVAVSSSIYAFSPALTVSPNQSQGFKQTLAAEWMLLFQQTPLSLDCIG